MKVNIPLKFKTQTATHKTWTDNFIFSMYLPVSVKSLNCINVAPLADICWVCSIGKFHIKILNISGSNPRSPPQRGDWQGGNDPGTYISTRKVRSDTLTPLDFSLFSIFRWTFPAHSRHHLFISLFSPHQHSRNDDNQISVSDVRDSVIKWAYKWNISYVYLFHVKWMQLD